MVFFYHQPSPKLHLRVRPSIHPSLKGPKELNYCNKSEGYAAMQLDIQQVIFVPSDTSEETEVAETYFSQIAG